MCISAQPSVMTDTIVYAHETIHPTNGQLVHVMAYQNKATSQGANAMLLPIPTKKAAGPLNFLDLSSNPFILKSYAEVYRAHTLRSARRTRGFGPAAFGPDGLKGVQQFDVGSYTVLLAERPSHIKMALRNVPEHKRPTVSDELLVAFNDLYPNYPVLLACYTGNIEAEPLALWYEPDHLDRLFYPAVDAHDGGAPRFSTRADVSRNHTLIWGLSTRDSNVRLAHQDEECLDRQKYWDYHPLTTELEAFFPRYFFGKRIMTQTTNSDFIKPIGQDRVAWVTPKSLGRPLPLPENKFLPADLHDHALPDQHGKHHLPSRAL